ncbi:MAG: right-handed parallel beta-helix repeat-containing protein, partial [Planctomycetaceae bacterium]|nr:right-handed parallel beta-helix repeat-containing protein [Planctomycetaceae bacterium]
GAFESSGIGIGTPDHPLRIRARELAIKLASDVNASVYIDQTSSSRLSTISVPGGTVVLSGGTFQQTQDNQISPDTNLVLTNGAVWSLVHHSSGGSEGEEPTYFSTTQHLRSLTVQNGTVTADAFQSEGEEMVGGIVTADLDFEFWQAHLSATLSGPSGLTKRGTGSVTIDTAQSYSGPTVIEEGNVVLISSTTNNLISADSLIDVRNDGVLDVSQLQSFNAELGDWTTGMVLRNPQRLTGTGEIQGDIIDEGEIAPGPTFGSLSFTGNVTLSSNGRFLFQIAGTDTDQNQTQLQFFSDVLLTGELALQISPDYDSKDGDRFLILDKQSDGPVSGHFRDLPEGAVFITGTESFRITYEGGDGNDVMLETVLAVLNTDDDGFGSLRRAMTEANTLPGANTIVFSIPGTGSHVISPLTPLPALTGPTRIHANTQPGYFDVPLVELRGHSGLPDDTDGIRLESDGDSEIIGLNISGFSGAGLHVISDEGFVGIDQNFFGPSLSGLALEGNKHFGVVLTGNATIGLGYVMEVTGAWTSLLDGNGNVVSGNGDGGVLIDGAGDVYLQGNHIGVRADGTQRLPNTGAGITLRNEALAYVYNGNVISGNSGDGILMEASATYLEVSSTIVGLNKDGTQPIANQGVGIHVVRDDASPGNGGMNIFESTVSGNLGGGISIEDARTSTNNPQVMSIESSLIGMPQRGTKNAANRNFGLRISQPFMGLPDPEVESPFQVYANVISGNSGPGLWLQNVVAVHVTNNRLGTTAEGTAAVPNDTGVYLDYQNRASAFAEFVDNTISGNRTAGIWLNASNSSEYSAQASVLNAQFIGNTVGTDAHGGRAIPNGQGVLLEFSTDAEVAAQQLVRFAGGVISGNNGNGVTITGTARDAFVELDTLIGASALDTLPPGNRGNGVLISSDSVRLLIHGDTVIAANRGNGIRHEGTGRGANITLGHTTGDFPGSPIFFGNLGMAIDLGTPGPTDNEGSATDFPVIEEATLIVPSNSDVGFLNIVGTNTPVGGYFLQFYATRPTVTGRGQGALPIGEVALLGGLPDEDSITDHLSGLTPELDLDPRPDHFRYRISVPATFESRLLTAVILDPLNGMLDKDYGHVSEFSPIIPIGTQLTHLPPVVDAGADVQLSVGASLQKSVSFRDDDSVEFEVVVDYGEGAGFSYGTYRPQDRVILLDHTYQSVGQYVVSVSVMDDTTPFGLIDIDSFIVTVDNALPEIRFNEVEISKRVVEGETVDLNGTFEDADVDDLHTVEVDWGDGSIDPPQTLAVGDRSFSLNHVYLDDGQSGASSHLYRVVVTVRDKSGATSATPVFLVQVDNVLPQWNTTAPSLTLSDTLITEGGSVSLHGAFTDAGLLDSHQVIINWGDGSPLERVSSASIEQNENSRRFSLSHLYRDNPSSGSTYVIVATLADDDEPAIAVSSSVSVTVLNEIPVIQPLLLGNNSLEEGDLQAVFISFVDSGVETHSAMVNWGDGSPEVKYPVSAGSFSIAVNHRYDRDGQYTIQARIIDRDGVESDLESAVFHVTNFAPTLEIVGSNKTVMENESIELSGSFDDSSPLDHQTIIIDWGDGTTQTPAEIDHVNRTWRARHVYFDDVSGGSGSSTFTAVVTISDGTETSTASALVTVLNSNPVISVIPALSATSNAIRLRAIGSDHSPVDQLHLDWHWNVMRGGVPVEFTLISPSEIEFTPGSSAGAVIDVIDGLLTVTVWASDDDGGTSDEWMAGVIAGTSESDLIRVNDSAYVGGLTQLIVAGMDGDDVLDASGVMNPNHSVLLIGGLGDDLVFDGAGNDTILLAQGNDSLNIPLDDPRNTFTDLFGQNFQITPNMNGDDESFMVLNSVQEAWDSLGDNSINFSLNESAISQQYGVTFDLSLTQLTEAQTAMIHQDAVPASPESEHHFAGALGHFVRLTGSNYGDTLTASSGSGIFGGRGNDLFGVKEGMSSVQFHGGADDDVLINNAGNLSDIFFGGDDGSDRLENTGAIVDLVFTGGADDDVLQNLAGAIITGLSFGGDDGTDALINNGTLAELVFTGGADDDVLQNLADAVITGLAFGGDDGTDSLLNNGTLAELVFTGGADDDVLQNFAGAVITGLSFGGDDGTDSLLNNGTLADLVFTGGADDDVLQNLAGAVITGLSFGGDDGTDSLLNNGTLADLVFTGGADDDVLQNFAGAVITGLSFGGDDGTDSLLNNGTLADLVFTGGADDDVLQNFAGAVITGLSFGGDDGSDVLINSGTLSDLTFTGGADDDVLRNLAGASIIDLSFGGDDGSDQLINNGALSDLVFTGGADDDILRNLASAEITGLSFGGDDGADFLVNSGTLADLVFTGGADDDVLQNMAGAVISGLSFGGDDGSDFLINNGSLTDLTFTGGADDDVLQNLAGAVITTLAYGGDDGYDLLINLGTLNDVVFNGGADDDVLQN